MKIKKLINSFVDYIKRNNVDDSNLIFVLDRAYFSYDLINFLIDKKIKFVIRVKNNCLYLKNDKEINKIKSDEIRFIKYKYEQVIVKKDKDYKDVKLEYTNKCNLVTNLDSENYKDDIVNKIYLMRWDVEVFFKLIKSNFKFAILREHSNNTTENYKKKYVVILIILHIIRLIELISDKNIKKKVKKKKVIININILLKIIYL